MIGDHALALEPLEVLPEYPSWVSPAWLKLDPAWDPLRNDPHFTALLARYEGGGR